MQQVEMFFDYASPWAYLADALLETKLAGVSVLLRPVYLRGFAAFSQGLPYPPAKMHYIARDFARCAEHEAVAFTPPAVFPINGLHALRGALAAERAGHLALFHRAVFRAAWADDRDVSNKHVIAEIARELGLPAVAEGLDDPWAKAELRARTESAVSRGVFGVPTFAAGDELFWGHDRLDYVRRFALSD